MNSQPIVVQAPCRIDLAGGTLDIPPLYLFLPECCTVNLAVDIMVVVEVEAVRGDSIRLESVDRGLSAAFRVDEAVELPAGLKLLERIVRHFKPETGLEIRARSHSPAGAGLGASSALCAAAVTALQILRGELLPVRDTVQLCLDLEAIVLGTPAGYQDFYSALNGGLQEIELGPGGIDARVLESDIDEIERHAMLVYTGRPHHSGLNNWEVFKAFIDGDEEVRRAMTDIGYTAVQMAGALKSGDWPSVGRLLGREWEQRKRLSPSISTPLIDALVERAAELGGSGKVCGAGGGGCLLIWYDGSQETEQEIREAARRLGATPIDWRPAVEGCAAAFKKWGID
jgi:D-glycero-alpha-D-manno-heptose-7-phosphate kinase